MNIIARIRSALSALFNRYEAAQPSGPNRSYIPAYLQDARFDADQMSRQEMCRKIRYFERNLWLVRRLREVDIKYSVGPNGMPVIPASADPEWNVRMQEAYEQWCEDPTRDSLLPMSQVHRLMAGEAHIDGEVFLLQTYRKAPGQQAVPAIQLIESHRVGSPNAWNSKPSTIDGVEVDRNGRPTGFWIREGVADDSWTFRAANEVLQIGLPERIGMYRHVTPYHAALNTSHDLDDLELLEMERARNNASVANVIKSQTGEMPASLLHRQAFLSGKANVAGTTTSNDDADRRIGMLRKILGSRTIALHTNEELQQFDNKNPSASTQWYWMHKTSQVCVTVNIPMILVLPESVQGTVARAVLDDAHQSFRAKHAVFAGAARAAYRHFARWAMYNVAGLYPVPDWGKCHVIPPRACNVDYGRNSAAMLAELAAGTTSYDDIYGAAGSTAEVGLRKKGQNIALIKRIAREVSEQTGERIEPGEIAAPLADILQKLASADAADAAENSRKIEEEETA